MERLIYLCDLYDYYKNLFTDKQQLYFEDYYFNNLSLSEIAENNGISRNAVHGQLKIIDQKLEEYESKLNLLNKKNEIKKLLDGVLDDKLMNSLEQLL